MLGRDGLRAVKRTLVPKFMLSAPIGGDLARDDKELKSLTEAQFRILEALKNNERVAIPGGAGTGKTVLAVEEAIRCARNGARTLFVCFNQGLETEVAIDCVNSRKSPCGGFTSSVGKWRGGPAFLLPAAGERHCTGRITQKRCSRHSRAGPRRNSTPS